MPKGVVLLLFGLFMCGVAVTLHQINTERDIHKEDAVAPVPCVEKTPTLEERNMSLGEAARTLRATESRLLDKYEACLVLVRECVDSCCRGR